jgi:hypothetical protein
MSPCNRRAAAAAAIGVLAGTAPVGAAGAAPNHGPSPVRAPGGSDHGDQGNGTDLIPASRRSVDPPPEPGAGGPGGSTPQDLPTAGTDPPPASTDPPPASTDPPPASTDPSTSTQCGPVEFTNMLPTVITCGPVTINVTFNTTTTTTTVTTVAAPITAANGAITTGVTNPAPAGAVRRKQARSRKARTTRPKRRRPAAGVVRKPMHGRRIVRVRVLLGPRPSR